MIGHMRQILRTLGRSPNFLLSAVAVLALGLAASTLVFTIAHALVLSPLEYRNPDTLVQLRERDPQGSFSPLSAASFRLAQTRNDAITSPAAVDMGMFMLTGVAEPEEFAGAAITPNALQTLGVQPLVGHGLTASNPDEVLLSYAAWSRRFGADPNIVGKVIDLDWARTPQMERYRVAGVLPQRFWLFYRGLEAFIPLTGEIIKSSGQRRRYYAFARRTETANLTWSLPLDRPGWTLVGSSLSRDLTEDSRPALMLLSAAVILLVMLACANVANLFLVRGFLRRPEFAVRLALGASRWDVARIVVAEAMFVALSAAVIAVPLAHYGLVILRRWLSGEAGWMQFTPGFDRLAIDGWTLTFAACAAFLCCLLAAAIPARQSSATGTQLHGFTVHQPFRQLLIGVEAALATVLLCGSGLLLKSLVHLNQANFGFAPERMLVVRVPGVRSRGGPGYYDELRRRVEALPGVEAVTFTSFQPLTNSRPQRRFSSGDGPEDSASDCVVATNFFSVYRVPLRQGRIFNGADRTGAPPVVIVNESLARKHFTGKSPLGARIQFVGDATPFEIVGVVADVRQSLRRPVPPTIYRPAAQDPATGLQMGVRTHLEPLALASAIRREIGLAGGAAAELSTLEQFVFSESWRTHVTAALMTGFSLLALTIAGFGIFSVISYAVSQRRREMGIRSALGARPADIILLLVGEGLRPMGVGLVVGLVVALSLSRFVRGLLFEVQESDPVSYSVAALVLFVVALCAIAIPARRAASANPAESLRQF
jgi:putative ABC transport system permease protein